MTLELSPFPEYLETAVDRGAGWEWEGRGGVAEDGGEGGGGGNGNFLPDSGTQVLA